jgi:succinylglutamate desuccinylase
MDVAPRELGSYDAGIDGPTLVVVGGLHGNEPSGVLAIERVMAELQRRRPPMRGRVVAFRGNRRALAAAVRFVDRDLNRGWDTSSVARVLAGDVGSVEDGEQRELLVAFAALLEHATRPIMFLDLHSTSGRAVPFACGADVLRNRRALFGLDIPVVLGLEEVIEGSMLGYLCDLGHAGISVEGGSHFEPETVDNHVAVVWLVMLAEGLLDAASVPDLDGKRDRLRTAAAGKPRVLEVVHREVVGPDDPFVMNEGWRSFQPVTRGEVVAAGRDGAIRSPFTGLMLLPRYQGQGEDGFFVARQVRRAWLRVSAVARWLRLDRTLPFVPGVFRDPNDAASLVARGSAAKWLAPELFHLFGYRRSRATADGRVFMRRQPDDVGLRRLPKPP